MEYYVELKLKGDAFGTGFSNGMTMCQSQSTGELEKVEESEQEIVYRNNKGHKLTLQKKKEDGVTKVCTTFKNEGEEDAVIDMLSSFALKEVRADKIHRLQSFWSAEGKLRTETIKELHLEPSWNRCATRVEKFGTVGSMPVRKYFPFIVLEDSEAGHFVGVQLYIPSSWQIELLCREDNWLRVVGGIADHDFGHWRKNIAPGESFITPKAVIAEGESLYDVCDLLVKAQHPMISEQDPAMGILFNEYCTTWGNPSFENMKRICDQLKGKGISFLVMDSGWYGKGDTWWNSIGDWEVNENKFPGGLRKTADYIRSCGMTPGLWFEIEAVGKESKYYNAKEHLLTRDDEILTVGERRFWDMEDPWVIDHLTEKVIGTLKEGGFGYLKVDYNDTIGVGCEGAESLGEGLRRKVIATQKFFEKIREEIPGIVIENCSSGGHRLEPSMMELCSQASFSDAHETKAIPVIAANMHRVIRPEQSQIWAVMRKTDDRDRIYYSIINTFFGRMCLSGDIYDLNEEQWVQIEEGMNFYRQAAEIIRSGKTIFCESDPDSYNDPKGWQTVIRTYKDQELVIVHRFKDAPERTFDFLKDRQILAEYGELEHDFCAKAWILKK